ncbi:MAG: imidazolonepropionase [Bacteroidetes bacterium]|nr:MAG: imidazolonepropionase [Bacteroidota bacterium]
MDILIENIKGLVLVCTDTSEIVAGASMSQLPVIERACLLIRNGTIHWFGPMDQNAPERADQVIDATGRFVFPCFVDSHTHMVFAGSREGEFVDKIKGMGYEEIAKKGGGILNSAKRLQNTSEEELYDSALERLEEVISTGTGAIEIKSGYGLTTEDEMKMLRVARRLKESTSVVIKTTFLGAHAIPANIPRQEYIEKVIKEMIPKVAGEGLAEYCDVFCEEGFFTPDETRQILEQGLKYGLKPKIHANQLNISGGVQVGVACGAISVDHLESIGRDEIDCLKNSNTIPTLLPGAAFFLNMNYPPARDLISAGLPVTLASDYNPGSAPSGNMPLILSLACIKMKMSPEEAIIASTINGAFALEIQHQLGSISVGKVANVFITKPIPSTNFFPYAFGSRLIETVILNGQIF